MLIAVPGFVLHEVGAPYTHGLMLMPAVLFGGDLGVTYLGTEGDEWGAQKDMALATARAVTGLVLLEILARLRGRGPQATA